MQKLQWFLIKRFIQILLVVGVAEYVVTYIANQFIMPVVLSHFFPDYLEEFSVGGVEIVLITVALLMILVVSVVQLLFPSPVRDTLQFAGEQIQRSFAWVTPEFHSNVSIIRMDRTEVFFLFLTTTAIAYFILMPYIIGAIVFARITTREFQEIQRQKEEERQEFDRKRNLMLSDIAHDLRTPITTVSGYAKALSDGLVTDPERQQEYLEAIQNKSVRMSDLINLLFEYVKLDSEGFSLERKPVDLCELLRENAALVYSDIESSGMELQVEIPEERIEISADYVQLSRVITNLLSNAKHHNAAGTKIGLFLIKDLDRIHVLVADTGDTIPEDLAEKLFEPFAKADSSRTGSGSGLGLSIAKKVVQMHGWELSLLQKSQLREYAEAAEYTKAFEIRIQ